MARVPARFSMDDDRDVEKNRLEGRPRQDMWKCGIKAVNTKMVTGVQTGENLDRLFEEYVYLISPKGCWSAITPPERNRPLSAVIFPSPGLDRTRPP